MNLITHLSASYLSQFHSAKKRKNTERFEAHRLEVKLQNESNVNILKLCFFIIRIPTASFKGADTIEKVHIWALVKVLPLLKVASTF